jgi:hypothetical protein
MRRGLALVVAAFVAAPGSAPAAASDTVTLVTGDRVTLAPSGAVIFDPAPGSRATGFDVLRDGTHVHVVPDDVASLVPDVLDPALFDVTALVEMGYDDRHSDELPLIVRRAAGARSLASPLQAAGPLSSIGATAAELDKDDAADFGDDLAAIGRPGVRTAVGGLTKVWLDRRIEADALDPYLTQVRPPPRGAPA